MTKADKIQIYKVIEERKRLIVQNEKGDATFYEAPHETEEGAWYFLIENNFLWDNQLMGKEIARRIREGIVERKAKFPSPHTSLPVYVKVFAQLNYVSVVWRGTDPEFPQLEIFPDTEYLLGSEANKKRLLEALNKCLDKIKFILFSAMLRS